jgi:PAS domain-containing protein
MDFDVARLSSILVKSMADAVIYADTEGRIRFWNGAPNEYSVICKRRRWNSHLI